MQHLGDGEFTLVHLHSDMNYERFYLRMRTWIKHGMHIYHNSHKHLNFFSARDFVVRYIRSKEKGKSSEHAW